MHGNAVWEGVFAPDGGAALELRKDVSLMEWTLLTQEQYVTTLWSGGTTTQLAIAPEGAVYADRDFLWRLSSAKVELPHSDFTPLPDYNRLISIVQGEMELKIGDGERSPLQPLQVRAFDGGVPVESWGKCSDFNLMMRKGACEGCVQGLKLEEHSALTWSAPVFAPQSHQNLTLAIFCARGDVTVGGVTAQAGQTLLCREASQEWVELKTQAGAELMCAAVYYG